MLRRRIGAPIGDSASEIELGPNAFEELQAISGSRIHGPFDSNLATLALELVQKALFKSEPGVRKTRSKRCLFGGPSGLVLCPRLRTLALLRSGVSLL